jgi:drug/metabolite transporter (DMT)-like permease
MSDRHVASAGRLGVEPESTAGLVIAFLAVYLIWGSTYFAIRVAIETLPPLLMAGVRFIVAGGALYVWARARGAPAPTGPQWRAAAILGAFLLLGGNGGVVWAETRVPSGIAAVLIASVALWMALLEWWRGEAPRPGGRIALGLALGMIGVALLVGGRQGNGERTVDLVGGIVLVLASASWAWGSLLARRADLPASRVAATGMQMLCGGVLLALCGFLRGEAAGFDIAAVSLRSWLAVAYLAVFGAIVAFSAYVYLLHATTPTRAATYAFVNPVVAVIIGALLGGERIPASGLAAVAITVLGVLLLVTTPRRTPPRHRVPVVAAAGAIAPENRVG